MIDERLLDCYSTPEIEANFNQVLALIDGLSVCTVAFDSDGGSAVPNQYLLNGALVAEPSDPAKTGNAFSGWYNGETAWDFASDKVLESMTLTAHWTTEG